ncbi:hypothetical protein RF11_04362 [Thelohanellus kitauei]|uniref:Uncharacterized protein n=1 Tax=Thelohanellus kitauei TaxID=669202 RepID=A0A0C2NEV2_THEKT|nr:hypothetical protein RF11_04362 [Thelohanellus kitauei]
MKKSSIDDVKELSRKADEFMKGGAFMADLYFEAVELANSLIDSSMDTIIALYENAAKCYFKIKDIRSYECYNKAGQINKGIQYCFEYGYRFFIESKEQGLCEKLYRKGDELRILHNLEHVCVITKFDRPIIKGHTLAEFRDAFNNAVFNVNELRKKDLLTILKVELVLWTSHVPKKKLVHLENVKTLECDAEINFSAFIASFQLLKKAWAKERGLMFGMCESCSTLTACRRVHLRSITLQYVDNVAFAVDVESV